MSKGVLYMIFNWRERLKKESNQDLLQLFSEIKRINIDPQLYAGNLLYERNYKIDLLRERKAELINAVQVAFNNKYHTDPQKIKRENTIREIILRGLLALMSFSALYYLMYKDGNILGIPNRYFPFLLGALQLLPLLRLKKSHQRAIQKVEREGQKKEELIEKIKMELRF